MLFQEGIIAPKCRSVLRANKVPRAMTKVSVEEQPFDPPSYCCRESQLAREIGSEPTENGQKIFTHLIARGVFETGESLDAELFVEQFRAFYVINDAHRARWFRMPRCPEMSRNVGTNVSAFPCRRFARFGTTCLQS